MLSYDINDYETIALTTDRSGRSEITITYRQGLWRRVLGLPVRKDTFVRYWHGWHNLGSNQSAKVDNVALDCLKEVIEFRARG